MAKSDDIQRSIPTLKLSPDYTTKPNAQDDQQTNAAESVERLTPEDLLTKDLASIMERTLRSGIVELPAGAAVTAGIHSYKIIERVQGGAMSSTYKAMHGLGDTEDMMVFLKILDSTIAPIGELPHEIRNIEQCRDLEHVVKVHRSHIDLKYQGKPLPPAIVTQWVEGPTLDDLLKQPASITYQEALAITEQIAKGLTALHEIGIIHRDIKPANIKLVPTGAKELWRKYDVKILDLGIGVKLNPLELSSPADGRHTPHNTSSQRGNAAQPVVREFIGTPFYASPEQFLGMTPTIKSDVYSMGLIAAELARKNDLNGQTIRTKERAAWALYESGSLDEFERPAVPRQLLQSPDELFAYHYLRRIALQALEPDPDRRPTADSIARRLSNRSRTWSRIKMTLGAAAISLIMAVPLLDAYHGRKNAQALAAEQLRLELSVYNPAKLDKADGAIRKARDFIDIQDFLEAERLCTDARQTLKGYMLHARAPDARRFRALRRDADLCLAESFLGQKEYGAAQEAFARLGDVTDDRTRILRREIALNSEDAASHDVVIAELRQVWRRRKASWAGNRLTEALTFKASQLSDKSSRAQEYSIALEHAGAMIAMLRPSPIVIDTAGDAHRLPAQPLPEQGQMQELERALLNRATIHRRLGAYGDARTDINEAVQLAQTLNDKLMLARSLMHLGVIEFHTSHLLSADQAFSGAIEHLRAAGSLGHLAEAYSKRGVIRNQLSMPAQAYEDAYQAGVLYKRFGNDRDVVLGARYTESLALLSLGRLQDTISFSQEAIGHALKYGNVERAGDYANIVLEGQWYAGAQRPLLDQAYAEAAKHLAGFEESYRNVYADIIYAYGLDELGASADALKALETAAAKPGFDAYNRGLAVALRTMIAARAQAPAQRDAAAIDELIAANAGTHEVLARLYAAKGVVRAGAGLPAQESFMAAVREADATKNLYHALDVRRDIAAAPGVPPELKTLFNEQVRLTLEGGRGVQFITEAYSGKEFSGF